MAVSVNKPFDWNVLSLTGHSWYYLHSSTHKVAMGLVPYADVTDTDISFYITGKTGTPPTYRIGIQADSSGKPSGTYTHSATFTPTANGWFTATLPSFTLNSGTKYWIVIQYESGTINTSNRIGVRRLGITSTDTTETRWPVNLEEGQLTYLQTSSSTWTNAKKMPIFMIGTQMGQPYRTMGEIVVHSTTHAGQIIEFSQTQSINSFSYWMFKKGSPTGDLTYTIYDSLGTALITGAVPVTADQLPTDATAPKKVTFTFDPLELTAGSFYRVVLSAPTGTDSSNYYVIKGVAAEESPSTYFSQTFNSDADIYIANSSDSGSTWDSTDFYKRFDTLHDLAVTKFWVGDGGSWSDSAHWSYTSGGIGGAELPDRYSNAIFNASSFTTTGQTVTVSGDIRANTLTWTAGNTLSLSSSSRLIIYGDVELNNTMTISGSGSLLLVGSGDKTVTASGAAVGVNLTFNQNFDGFSNTGIWTLGSALSVETNKISMANGVLNTDNFDITCGTFDARAGFATLNLGTSTLNIVNFYTDTTTVNADDATLAFYGASAKILGGSKAYGTITNTGAGALTIEQDNTIATLQSGAGTRINFEAGSTQTVTNFKVVGELGNLILLRSTTDGSQFTLSKSSGVVGCNYLDIKDSIATGGAEWYAGGDSIDSGNNA